MLLEHTYREKLMAIQSHFTKFHNKIKLTRESDDYSNARKKDESIMSAVRTAFNDEGYPVVDDFLQGSFSTHTAIHSLDGDFDIDHAVVIDNSNAPNNPIDPKKVVKKVLDDRGFKHAKIKKPCITADYASLSLHIDIPVYRKSDDSYQLAVGKEHSGEEHREWSASAPKELKDWVNDTEMYANSPNNTQQQFIRIVRYIKRWRDHKFSSDVRSKVFSIALCVMAKQCFQQAFDKDGKPEDLKALKATVDRILLNGYFHPAGTDKYKVSVYLPVTPRRDIFDGSSTDTGTQLQNKLNNLKNKLEDTCTENDEVKQCKILNKLFGDDFIVPDNSDSSNNSSGSASTLAAFSSAGVVGTSQGA